MFSAELKKPALKFLKSIKDKTLLKRISDRIDELEKNPFPQDIERVEGYKDVKVFRVRVGDYRILYFVDYSASKFILRRLIREEGFIRHFTTKHERKLFIQTKSFKHYA